MQQHGQSPIQYIIIFAVIASFVYRNMRPQTLTAGRLWVLPVFLVLVTAFSIVATSFINAPGIAAPPAWMIALAVLVGIVAGVPLGLARGRASNVRLADKRGAMVVEPSMLFALIWLAAFAVRFGLRLLIPQAGGMYFALGDASMVFAAASIVAMRAVLYAKFKALHLEAIRVQEA